MPLLPVYSEEKSLQTITGWRDVLLFYFYCFSTIRERERHSVWERGRMKHGARGRERDREWRRESEREKGKVDRERNGKSERVIEREGQSVRERETQRVRERKRVCERWKREMESEGEREREKHKVIQKLKRGTDLIFTLSQREKKPGVGRVKTLALAEARGN